MLNSTKGLLIVLSGPSGVGKGTICQKLVKSNPHIVYSVSATTRKRRPDEIDGVHYFFVSGEKFDSMIEHDEFLEYTQVFSEHSYGTPKEYVLSQLNKGLDVILEIDVQGGLKVKETLPEAVLVFVAPPNMKELKNRLISRGTESERAIALRTDTAYQEMSCVSYYDYVIVNNTVEHAIESIQTILKAEKFRVSRREEYIDQLLEGCDFNDE